MDQVLLSLLLLHLDSLILAVNGVLSSLSVFADFILDLASTVWSQDFRFGLWQTRKNAALRLIITVVWHNSGELLVDLVFDEVFVSVLVHSLRMSLDVGDCMASPFAV